MSIREGTLSPELEARYLEPYTYTVQHWGNHIGPKLIEAFNYWLKLPQDKLETIQNIVRMLHNACVLLDDIQDNSAFRAGLPVAHRIYGIPLTINAATNVYFLALQKLLDDFPEEFHSPGLRILTEQWLQMHRGQGVEMVWREAFISPTEEEYLELAPIKSGCFIILIVDLMQLFSEDKRDFGKLNKLMAVYFEIANDYDNFKSKEPEEYKGFADDLTEGKFSFPILHAIRQSPDDKSLINILKQRTENVDLKKYAVSRMEEAGSLAYTHQVMNEYLVKTLEEVEKLGGNPPLESLLEYTKKYTKEAL